MKLENTDFGEFAVIAYVDEKEKPKKALARIKPLKGESYTATLDNRNIFTSPDSFKIKSDQILATLGADIREEGSVFGVKIEPLRYVFKVKGFCTVYVHRVLLAQEEKMIKDGLAAFYQRLLKRKYVEPGFNIDVELRPKKGKWAGSYHYMADQDGKLDILTLHPSSFTDTEESFEELLWHEIGHMLWHRRLFPDQRAAWVELYNTATEINILTKARSKELLTNIVQSNYSVKDYLKENESERDELKQILKHISSTNKLDLEMVDLLKLRGQKLKEVAPKVDIEKGVNNSVISDYSRLNPAEYWAETCRLFHTNKEVLPEQERKLMSTQLKSAK